MRLGIIRDPDVDQWIQKSRACLDQGDSVGLHSATGKRDYAQGKSNNPPVAGIDERWLSHTHFTLLPNGWPSPTNSWSPRFLFVRFRPGSHRWSQCETPR